MFMNFEVFQQLQNSDDLSHQNKKNNSLLYIYFAQLAVHYYNFIMSKRFSKVECPQHKLPVEFVCILFGCPCEKRLCVCCINEGCHKEDSSQVKYVPEISYCKSIEYDVKSLGKKYAFLEKRFGKQADSCLFKSLNEESKKIGEYVVHLVNTEKVKVINAIDSFQQSQRQQLATIQKTYNRKYLETISNPTIFATLFHQITSKGLDKLRFITVSCQSASNKFNQILVENSKFGKKTESFLTQLGFKSFLIEAIKSILNDIKPLVSYKPRRLRIFSHDHCERKQSSQKSAKKTSTESNKCEEVICQAPSTPRKPKPILLTPEKPKKPKRSFDAKKPLE